MSRIHLRSSSVVLWLSLSAVVAASALSIGCSSDSDSGGSAGESSGGSSGSAGSSAGESAAGAGDEAGAAGSETGGTGGTETGGTGGAIGVAGDTSEAGAGGGETVDPNAEAIERAQAVIAALPLAERCTTCHQLSYSGSGTYPNITPDEAKGIGLWTDDEVKAAILEGKHKDGSNLCLSMPRFDFSEAEVSDIIVLLRNVTPSTKARQAACD
jgi:hypothetical protein